MEKLRLAGIVLKNLKKVPYVVVRIQVHQGRSAFPAFFRLDLYVRILSKLLKIQNRLMTQERTFVQPIFRGNRLRVAKPASKNQDENKQKSEPVESGRAMRWMPVARRCKGMSEKFERRSHGAAHFIPTIL